MSRSRVLLFVTTCYAMVMCAQLTAFGVVNGTPAPNADRRFDAVGLFMRVAPGAECGGWISGSCTLIGPTTVLIARHSLDINATEPLPSPSQRTYRVRFRRSASGASQNSLIVGGSSCSGVYQEVDIVRLSDAPNHTCDQVLATLDHAPIGIQPIGLELNNPPLTAVPAMIAGWGYDGECYGAGEPWTLRVKNGIIPANWSGNDYLLFTTCSISATTPCLVCAGNDPSLVANLHDSGAPILIQVPSTDPLDPTPELRLIGTVSTTSTARRPSAWNNAGGWPRVLPAAPRTHLLKSDFDGNGVSNVSDLFGYLNAFFAGRLDADLSGDGVLGSSDIFLFINAWFSHT